MTTEKNDTGLTEVIDAILDGRLELLLAITSQLQKLDFEKLEIVGLMVADVLDALNHEGGSVIILADTDGNGMMNAHLVGDRAAAVQMLAAAPTIYRKAFTVPEGAAVQ